MTMRIELETISGQRLLLLKQPFGQEFGIKTQLVVPDGSVKRRELRL